MMKSYLLLGFVSIIISSLIADPAMASGGGKKDGKKLYDDAPTSGKKDGKKSGGKKGPTADRGNKMTQSPVEPKPVEPIEPPQTPNEIAERAYKEPYGQEMKDTPLILPDGTETNVFEFLVSNRVLSGNPESVFPAINYVYAYASELIDYEAECLDRDYGLDENQQTDLFCDVYNTFLQICDKEEDCDGNEFRTYKVHPGKGSVLSNTDAAVETICFIDILSATGTMSFGQPFCPDVAKEQITPQVEYIQYVITTLVSENFDNPLLSYSWAVGVPPTTNEATIIVGDAVLEYRNYVDETIFGGSNIGVKNFIVSMLFSAVEYLQYDNTLPNDAHDAVVGYLLEKYSDTLLTSEEYSKLQDYFEYTGLCAIQYGAKLAASTDYSIADVVGDVLNDENIIGEYPTCFNRKKASNSSLLQKPLLHRKTAEGFNSC